MKKLLIVIIIISGLFNTCIALEENTIEILEQSSTQALLPQNEDNTDYLPVFFKNYYDYEEYEQFDNRFQTPNFIKEELELAKLVEKQWQGGKRPNESVLNKTEDVVVGVYKLNPLDYAGEKAYVILPNKILSEYEILQIYDAFNQIDLKFDPENLSYKNCVRGGGINSTRFATEEEINREIVLYDLFVRQNLKPSKRFTNIVSDDGCGLIKLSNPYLNFLGAEYFKFIPYRIRTDEELLMEIDINNTVDFNKYNMAELEKETRTQIHKLLNAPLSVKRLNENIEIASNINLLLPDNYVYQCTFSDVNIKEYVILALLDINTKRLLYAYVNANSGELNYSDLHGDPYDNKWNNLTKILINGFSDVKDIKNIETLGEQSVQNYGYGVRMKVIMNDNSYYELSFNYQNEQLSEIEYYQSVPEKKKIYSEEQPNLESENN